MSRFTDSNGSIINLFARIWWGITTVPSRKYWKRIRNSLWKTLWITSEGTRPPSAISVELKACPLYSATIATRDNSMEGRIFYSFFFAFSFSLFVSSSLRFNPHWIISFVLDLYISTIRNWKNASLIVTGVEQNTLWTLRWKYILIISGSWLTKSFPSEIVDGTEAVVKVFFELDIRSSVLCFL